MRYSQGLHLSLADSISSTDIYSNHTILSDLQLRLHLKPINDGEMPPELVPTFIHELTHHWCFASPVGTALFVTKSKALLEASLLCYGLGGREETLENALLTYDASIAMLRPYAEGLALFAEYDAWSLTPLYLSPPLGYIAIFSHAVFERVKDVDPANVARLHLILSRTLPEARNKKADLLVQSLAGPYLPGYLTIKNVWRAHLSKAGRTVDSDKFLSFMRSYIYNDFGLVSLLLDNSIGIDAKIERIGKYIPERLLQLFDVDLLELINTYEKHCLDSSPKLSRLISLSIEDMKLVDGILQEPESARLGQERLVNAIRDLLKPDTQNHWDDGYLANGMSKIWSTLFAQRHYICIGSTPVIVKLDQSGRVYAYDLDGSLMSGGPALPGVMPGDGPGILDVHLVPISGTLVLNIARKGETVLSNITEDGPYNLKKQFIGKLDRDFILNVDKMLQGNLNAILKKSEPMRLHHNNVLYQVKRGTERLYTYIASLPFGGSEAKAVKEKLCQTGFWDVFERDSDLIRQIAYLSILTSTLVPNDEPRDILANEGIDYENLRRRISKIEKCNGISLFAQPPGSIVSWI